MKSSKKTAGNNQQGLADWLAEEDRILTERQKANKRTFTTGSVRDTDKHKPAYDMISPIALKALADHCRKGSLRYGADNWMLGQPLRALLASLERHLEEVRLGFTDEDHAAAIMWNAMAYIHTKTLIDSGDLPKELDDLPKYSDKIREQLNWNK